MKLFTFIGKAGTGKTQLLVKLINKNINDKRNNCYVCANTHSAVNNIRQRIKSLTTLEINNKYINTIYSIFGINYVKQIVNGLYLPNESKSTYNVFIDEFSLIPLILFNRIIMTLERYDKLNINVFIFGDPLQLGPVISKDNNYISFNELDNWINRINVIANEKDYGIADIINVVNQFHNTTFTSKYVIDSTHTVLKINFRQNDITRDLLNDIYNFGKYDYNDFKCNVNELRDLIKNDEYVFISSKYKHLQKVVNIVGGNNRIKNVKHLQALKEIRIDVGQTIIIHDTLKDKERNLIYFNNERLIFKDYDDSRDVIHAINENGNEICLERNEGTFYITPDYVTTIHKAQGQTINNIIVCLDDLYSFPMLYTAITRARHNVKFFSFTNEDMNSLINKNSYYNSFTLAEHIVDKF